MTRSQRTRRHAVLSQPRYSPPSRVRIAGCFEHLPVPRTRDRVDVDVTLGTFLQHLRELHSDAALGCPLWPPDLLAITQSLLYQANSYRFVVRYLTVRDTAFGFKSDWRWARQVGRRWRAAIDELGATRESDYDLHSALNAFVVPQWWNRLMLYTDVPVINLTENLLAASPLFRLYFAAAGACGQLEHDRAKRKTNRKPALQAAVGELMHPAGIGSGTPPVAVE